MPSTNDVAPGAGRWREKQWLLPCELAVVAALTLGHRHVPLSATPFFVALGWISLRRRGLRWRDVGLVPPRPWLATLLLGALAGVGLELFSVFVSEPALARLAGERPDLSDFRPLVGNPRLLLVALVANWLLAAFGEEMAFRGYLLNRFAALGQGTRGAWWLSLVIVSVVFGACHHEVQGIDRRAAGRSRRAAAGPPLPGPPPRAGGADRRPRGVQHGGLRHDLLRPLPRPVRRVSLPGQRPRLTPRCSRGRRGCSPRCP